MLQLKFDAIVCTQMVRASAAKARASLAGAKATKTPKVNGHTNGKLEKMETDPVDAPVKTGRKRKAPEEEEPHSPAHKGRGRKRAAVDSTQQSQAKKAKGLLPLAILLK